MKTRTADSEPTRNQNGSACANLFISIIVPIRNEALFIAQSLNSLLAQDYPRDRFEILVVDGMSTDGTLAIVSELAANTSQIRVFPNPLRLSSAGRNVGHTRGARRCSFNCRRTL